MTTIAWDGKTLAADSQCTGDWLEQYPVNKIHKVDDCYLAGAGNSVDLIAYINGEEIKGDEIEVLRVTKKGKVTYHKNGNGHLDVKGKTAIGSGAGFAMGAMLAGATATETVKIASKLDPYTGGKIKSVKIK